MGYKTAEKPIFILIADLAEKQGAAPLNKHAGLWECRLDSHWEIALNGHRETLEWAQTSERMGCDIPPFHCVVMFNGWLAGLFDAYGGTFAAGELANEQTFIEALEKAILQVEIP
jgi:hypothetical protein